MGKSHLSLPALKATSLKIECLRPLTDTEIIAVIMEGDTEVKYPAVSALYGKSNSEDCILARRVAAAGTRQRFPVVIV